MRLGDMKAKCRKCGKELRADSKDEDFATFYCMVCGIYTNRPIEEFKDEPLPTTPPAPAPEKKDETKAC